MRTKMFTPKDIANMRWFWSDYLKQKTGWLFLIFLMIVLQGFVLQQFLAITETGLRVIFTQGDLRDLLEVCALIFGIFAVRAATSYFIPSLSARLAGEAIFQMRSDLITRVLYFDQKFFDGTHSTDLILRLVNQVQDLGLFVGQATVNALRDFVIIVIVSGYLIYKSPLLFCSALVALPVIFLMMHFVSARIKVIRRNFESVLGRYMSNIDEMAGGMRTIKMARQEKLEINRMVDASSGIKSLFVKLQQSEALMLPSIDLSSAVVYMLVVGGGGYMALSDQFDIDGASIISFLLGLVIIFDPARLLAQFFAKLQASLILLDSIRSLMLTEREVSDRDDAKVFDAEDIEIKIASGRFGYTPSEALFNDLNLTFKAGQKTAIVGATGSGKTTVLSLITRLYELSSGTVLFNGDDIKDFTLRSVRDKFSIVAQDVVIFDKSIKDNIRYADPDASDDAVLKAAQLARIDDLMLSRGDASVGPKGNLLSGGQKQRIAIARAFLKPAPVLLLDEATSALDAITEESVNLAFQELQHGKTTIVVAHKLSGIQDADHIYVLDSGRVIEAGTHADLISENGLYASMCMVQSKPKDSPQSS